VDRDNDYLISRFDGMVLDAKPWNQLQAGGLNNGAMTPPPPGRSDTGSPVPSVALSELEVGNFCH